VENLAIFQLALNPMVHSTSDYCQLTVEMELRRVVPCNTHRRGDKRIQEHSAVLKQRGAHPEDLGLGDRITLKCIFKKYFRV
jgi:hypothetical protein